MELKRDPVYGYFPWWPQDGDEWIHPEDAALARKLIPSDRVFRRDGQEGEFAILHYGKIRLRALPALWQEVNPEGFEMGDWVEVLSRGTLNEPHTGVIREINWDANSGRLRYQIADGAMPIPNWYWAEDLRHTSPTNPPPPP